ncbi:uncharacterized protein E6C27_scaffold403G001310 [Cucumis melo var. makuwa]|uniref:Retrotransposon gag domain-containing protein n=1 Tax=Cucumis melo var. makuwa TaxID=1194695 RepID=A0A5A7T2I3_CUCMM|nr:uncharacterized protein E6C27_scaffold403G001310 [Cucumis melo var. makuwa]
MSLANPSGKAQRDRLVELEEHMLYLAEVPDFIRFLESRLEEIAEKLVQSMRSSGFVAHIEERVNELDSSQKMLLKIITGMSEDFRATLDVVRNEIEDVNIGINLTMRAMANQVLVGGAVPVTKVKVPEPKPFCGVKDAKALENFIFDLEQYFKATNIVTEEAKVTLATMHLCEDAKLWWRSRYMDIQKGRCTINTWDVLKKELRSQFFPKNVEILTRQKLHDLKHTGNIQESKLYEQRVEDLTSAYAAAEWLFDLTSDSQDVRRHQSSSPGRNRNSHPSRPKVVGGDKRSSKDRRPYQSNTETRGEGRINEAHPSVPSVVSYVRGHIWQENV